MQSEYLRTEVNGMKALIVEDDLTSRILLQRILAPHGICDVATDGVEALKAFRLAWQEGAPYDLICLDIMMPNMDGQEVLREIRSFEKKKGIDGLSGVKIIMTTAASDSKNILGAFRKQCEAYLVKPILKAKLVSQIHALGLLQDGQDDENTRFRR